MIHRIAAKKLGYKSLGIPNYVAEWTDKYFHQSAFDTPLCYPSKRVVKFLSPFKKCQSVKLFRGLNQYNGDNVLVTSWSYNRKVAERYSTDGKGEVVEKSVLPSQILLDTTVLTNKQRQQLGYDYNLDDQEVLVLSC